VSGSAPFFWLLPPPAPWYSPVPSGTRSLYVSGSVAAMPSSFFEAGSPLIVASDMRSVGSESPSVSRILAFELNTSTFHSPRATLALSSPVLVTIGRSSGCFCIVSSVTTVCFAPISFIARSSRSSRLHRLRA